MTNRRRVRSAAIGLVLTCSMSASLSAQAPQRLPVNGINNFWRVDKDISTGGTITARDAAIPALKARGIRTVIDLAGTEADAERAAVEKAGMKYLVFAINGATLDPSPVDPFLKAVSDRSIYPIFIHSGAGHRAGMALMLTRVLVDNWSIEKAGIEAASAGLVLDNDMAPVWWKFARDYLRGRGK